MNHCNNKKGAGVHDSRSFRRILESKRTSASTASSQPLRVLYVNQDRKRLNETKGMPGTSPRGNVQHDGAEGEGRPVGPAKVMARRAPKATQSPWKAWGVFPSLGIGDLNPVVVLFESNAKYLDPGAVPYRWKYLVS